jgi:phosphatidylserine decarboxylase
VHSVWDTFWEQELLEIVTYLSLVNVHVQRAPLDGVVVAKRWRPGAFHSAAGSRAETENHELATYIRTPHGPCVVKQRAGLVARRIVSWVADGDDVQAGDRIGMIKFGSQTTVCLPATFEPLVQAGSLVKAGLTPVARLPE